MQRSFIFPNCLSSYMAPTNIRTPFSGSTHSQFYSVTSRTACESCHKNKEKCDLIHNKEPCSRCHRLGKICHARTRKRLGRKPTVRQFSHGSASIVSLMPESKEYGTHLGSAKTSTCGIEIPARASFINVAVPRGLDARNFRPDPSCHQLVTKVLSTRTNFFEAHRRFMMCDSFVDGFYNTVLLLFSHNPYPLTQAYHALLELMSGQDIHTTDTGSLDLTAGTHCLRSLIQLSSSVSDIQDAAVLVMMGQSALAYNAILPLDFSSRIITRGTLWSAKSWYPAMRQHRELDDILVAPVLIDTIDCLLRRDLPVVRLPEIDRCVVDRFSGVCSSFFPLLYDLCERSHWAKRTPIAFHGTDPYTNIEAQIAAWNPPYTQSFAKFTELETGSMLAQAHAFRQAALLVVHRLRYPLGTEDDVARHYAESILEELFPLLTWSSEGATGLLVDFPLLVALIEVPTLGENMFRAFERLRYRKWKLKYTLGFAEHVKRARLVGFQGLWFELVEDQFLGDFLP
ncbi:hypothetical protein B0J11DRAFT_307584 [Dendryphion nanum]|uniref:Zn(2)-C6 fungal-type domain-containing protein n=1 Tax=Dendryphion nanum TaxID=256645 RepID=A0A9P9DRR5_9PLEO|nr:hypothetical protein B0J11DRAFT_307584 [Dendryphion nanum]